MKIKVDITKQVNFLLIPDPQILDGYVTLNEDKLFIIRGDNVPETINWNSNFQDKIKHTAEYINVQNGYRHTFDFSNIQSVETNVYINIIFPNPPEETRYTNYISGIVYLNGEYEDIDLPNTLIQLNNFSEYTQNQIDLINEHLINNGTDSFYTYFDDYIQDYLTDQGTYMAYPKSYMEITCGDKLNVDNSESNIIFKIEIDDNLNGENFHALVGALNGWQDAYGNYEVEWTNANESSYYNNLFTFKIPLNDYDYYIHNALKTILIIVSDEG